MTSPNTPEHIILLAKKWREGSITDAERKEFELWYEGQDNVFEMNTDETREQAEERIYQALLLKGNIVERQEERTDRGYYKLWPRIAAAARIAIAAAIILVIGLSIFFYNRYTNTLRHPDAGQDLGLASNNIKPGSNKAYLILSNGKRLSLTDAANGAIAKEAGAEITKTADGQVVYASRDNNGDISGRHPELVSGPPLNTIETPRGGQYQVRLPDGSKVWLNAASKLTYPVSFTGRGQREVTLSGEAYFEIVKDKQHPFHVKSTAQDIEVLGTHFNVNTYPDEPTTKTTLLEGSVKVAINGGISGRHPEFISGSRTSNEVTLKPGEQATLQANKIKVTEVNAEGAVLWKNGKFSFTSEEISSVMRQVSRWYDVDIYYNDPVQSIKVTGSVSRFANISTLLDKLEQTGLVQFKIEGRKITVTK